MNVILNGNQSNTKRDDISLPASVDLTGKENLLWKIVNNGGAANFALATTNGLTATQDAIATAEWPVYVGMSGDSTTGAQSAAQAPTLGENCRILLDGTCNPGDPLSFSGGGGNFGANYGRLCKPALSTGSCVVSYIAEEIGTQDQLLLVRRVSERVVVF